MNEEIQCPNKYYIADITINCNYKIGHKGLHRGSYYKEDSSNYEKINVSWRFEYD